MANLFKIKSYICVYGQKTIRSRINGLLFSAGGGGGKGKDVLEGKAYVEA